MASWPIAVARPSLRRSAPHSHKGSSKWPAPRPMTKPLAPSTVIPAPSATSVDCASSAHWRRYALKEDDAEPLDPAYKSFDPDRVRHGLRYGAGRIPILQLYSIHKNGKWPQGASFSAHNSPLIGPVTTINPSTGLDNVWCTQYNPPILMSKWPALGRLSPTDI